MRLALARNRYCFTILLGLSVLSPVMARAATTTESDSGDPKEPPEYRFEFGLNGGAHFFNKKSGLGRNEGQDEGYSPKTSVAPTWNRFRM